MIIETISQLFQRRDAISNYWPFTFRDMNLPMPTYSGQPLTVQGALANGVVFRCIDLMSSTVAQIRCPLRKPKRGGGYDIASDHPSHIMVNVRPNPETTPFRWMKWQAAMTLMRGNGYSYYAVAENRRASHVWQLDPRKIKVTRPDERADLVYEYKVNDNQAPIPYDATEILHTRDFSVDGVTGVSRILMARNAIRLGLDYEEYAAKFLKNDSTPRGFLVTPNKLGKPLKQDMRKEFEDTTGGENKGRIGILDNGLDYKQVGLTLEDAQFLESRRFQIAEIARWFGVPLHMLGELDRSTNNNISQQSQEFYNLCMAFLLISIEQEMTMRFLSQEEQDAGWHFRFERKDLLQLDIEKVNDQLQKGVLGGIITPNEAREEKGMNPRANGDILLQPSAQVPLGYGVLTPNEQRLILKLQAVEGGDKLQSAQKAQNQDSNSDQNAQNDGQTGDSNDGKTDDNAQKADKKGSKRAQIDPDFLKDVFLPMFRDCFERVMSRETKRLGDDLRKCMMGGTADDGTKIIRDFYDSHGEYVERTLRAAVITLSKAAGGLAADGIDEFMGELNKRHASRAAVSELRTLIRGTDRTAVVESMRSMFSAWMESTAKQRAEQEIEALLKKIGD